MIKLNCKVTDKATGHKGIVTMLHIEMDRSETYFFQPVALNKKTSLPVDGIWASPDRLTGGVVETAPAVLPLKVLGTVVEDITGFKGMAVSLVLHSTGCVHFNVQPQGRDEDGNAIKPQNFSILRLKGNAIKKFSESEVEQEKKSRPSPGEYSHPQKCA